MFNSTGNQVAALGLDHCFGHTSDGEVVRFGAAAREDDLLRSAAEQGRNCRPRVIDDCLGGLAECMDARRVAESVSHDVGYHVDDRRIDWSRRVVVEVDSH